MRSIPWIPPVSALVAVAALSPPALAQTATDPASLQAYYRAVGEHFRVPAEEVQVLSEWDLVPDEIPVVLFLARYGGISSDALVAQKRAGRSWSDLATRYGVTAGAFHVPLEGSAAGSLASLYQRYEALPSSRWSEIALQDGDMIRLVNVETLQDVLGVSAAAIIQAYDRTGSFVTAYRSLLGR